MQKQKETILVSKDATADSPAVNVTARKMFELKEHDQETCFIELEISVETFKTQKAIIQHWSKANGDYLVTMSGVLDEDGPDDQGLFAGITAPFKCDSNSLSEVALAGLRTIIKYYGELAERSNGFADSIKLA